MIEIVDDKVYLTSLMTDGISRRAVELKVGDKLYPYYKQNPDKFVEEFFGINLLDSQKSFLKTLITIYLGVG